MHFPRKTLFFFAPQQGIGIILQEKGLCVLQYFEPLRTECQRCMVLGFIQQFSTLVMH